MASELNRRVWEALSNVTVEDPAIGIRIADSGKWIQIENVDLPEAFSRGRKWKISKKMSRSEILQTAFAAWMAWVEHEARESFRYMGEAIYGPHYDSTELLLMCRSRKIRHGIEAP